MANPESSPEADGLPVPAAPWRLPATLPVPPGFIPLRLVLQPSGVTVELTQPDMLLGRHSQADVRLPLPDVSRRHCRFLFSQGSWQVIDLNSLNGIFLNGELIRQAVVHSGDLIRIGGFTFAVELHEARSEGTETETAADLIRGRFSKPSLSLPSPDDAEGILRRRAS